MMRGTTATCRTSVGAGADRAGAARGQRRGAPPIRGEPRARGQLRAGETAAESAARRRARGRERDGDDGRGRERAARLADGRARAARPPARAHVRGAAQRARRRRWSARAERVRPRLDAYGGHLSRDEVDALVAPAPEDVAAVVEFAAAIAAPTTARPRRRPRERRRRERRRRGAAAVPAAVRVSGRGAFVQVNATVAAAEAALATEYHVASPPTRLAVRVGAAARAPASVAGARRRRRARVGGYAARARRGGRRLRRADRALPPTRADARAPAFSAAAARRRQRGGGGRRGRRRRRRRRRRPRRAARARDNVVRGDAELAARALQRRRERDDTQYDGRVAQAGGDGVPRRVLLADRPADLLREARPRAERGRLRARGRRRARRERAVEPGLGGEPRRAVHHRDGRVGADRVLELRRARADARRRARVERAVPRVPRQARRDGRRRRAARLLDELRRGRGLGRRRVDDARERRVRQGGRAASRSSLRRRLRRSEHERRLPEPEVHGGLARELAVGHLGRRDDRPLPRGRRVVLERRLLDQVAAPRVPKRDRRWLLRAPHGHAAVDHVRPARPRVPRRVRAGREVRRRRRRHARLGLGHVVLDADVRGPHLARERAARARGPAVARLPQPAALLARRRALERHPQRQQRGLRHGRLRRAPGLGRRHGLGLARLPAVRQGGRHGRHRGARGQGRARRAARPRAARGARARTRVTCAVRWRACRASRSWSL